MKKMRASQTAPTSDPEIQALINGLSKKAGKAGKYLLAALLCLVAGASMLIIFGQYVPWQLVRPLGYAVASLFVVVPVLFMKYATTTTKLHKAVAENLTRSVLQEVFEVETHTAFSLLKKDFIQDMGLIDGWNTVVGGDYVSGKYKGRGVIFSDICLQYLETDMSGNETGRTLFRGPWIIIEHDRTLTSPVWVREGGGAAENRNFQAESAAFNAPFPVIAGDGSAAHFTLTPGFIALLASRDAKAYKKTHMVFYENKICMAIHNNRFSFDCDRSDLKDINRLREKYRAEIKYITDILDELMKNDYLFKQ